MKRSNGGGSPKEKTHYQNMNMRKYIIALGLGLSAAAYADDVEVYGQFVVAPIAAEDCQAVALTEPTMGIAADSELLDMLAFFANAEHHTTTGIVEIAPSTSEEGNAQTAIYSIDGKKRANLMKGVNIIVDENGKARKVVVR